MTRQTCGGGIIISETNEQENKMRYMKDQHSAHPCNFFWLWSYIDVLIICAYCFSAMYFPRLISTSSIPIKKKKEKETPTFRGCLDEKCFYLEERKHSCLNILSGKKSGFNFYHQREAMFLFSNIDKEPFLYFNLKRSFFT